MLPIEYATAIRTNAERLYNRLRGVLWTDLPETFNFCLGLLELHKVRDRLKRRDRRSLDQGLTLLRASFRRTTPQRLLEVAEEYYRVAREVGFEFSSAFLGVGEHGSAQAVLVWELFVRAFQLIKPELVRLERSEPDIRRMNGLLSMYAQLIQSASHAWTLLVNAAVTNDQRAVQVLSAIFSGWHALPETTITFVPLSQWQPPTGYEMARSGFVLLGGIDVRVPVRDADLDSFDALYNRWIGELAKQNEVTLQIVGWFNAHRAELLAAERQMWQAIVADPKRGLRPNGLDKVRIELPNWSRAFVQLFPQAQFPLTFAKVWQYDDAFGGWCTLGFELQFRNWAEWERGPQYTRSIPVENRTWDLVARFMSLYTLWTIVCGEHRTKRTTKSGQSRLGDSGSTVHVRPHFRWLNRGEASEAAILRGIDELGALPPIGKTFVTAHCRSIATFEDDAAVREFEAIPALPDLVLSLEEFGFELNPLT